MSTEVSDDGATPPTKGIGFATLKAVVTGVAIAIAIALPAGALFVHVRDDRTTHALRGSITFKVDDPPDDAVVGGSCNGTGGFSDIAAGQTVALRNGADETIALGAFSAGNLVDVEAANTTGTNTLEFRGTTVVFEHRPNLWCRVPLTVNDVPNVAFYRLITGRRPANEYSRQQLEAQSWNVDLVLTAL